MSISCSNVTHFHMSISLIVVDISCFDRQIVAPFWLKLSLKALCFILGRPDKDVNWKSIFVNLWGSHHSNFLFGRPLKPCSRMLESFRGAQSTQINLSHGIFYMLFVRPQGPSNCCYRIPSLKAVRLPAATPYARKGGKKGKGFTFPQEGLMTRGQQKNLQKMDSYVSAHAIFFSPSLGKSKYEGPFPFAVGHRKERRATPRNMVTVFSFPYCTGSICCSGPWSGRPSSFSRFQSEWRHEKSGQLFEEAQRLSLSLTGTMDLRKSPWSNKHPC